MYSLQKSTRLALYALVEMTRKPGPLTASDFAASHGVPPNHVAKVLQQLRRGGLVESQRGAGGGYQLQRSADRITMLEVVELIEGPAGRDCSLREPGHGCAVRTCNIHGVLSSIEEFATDRLKGVSIAELAYGPLGPPVTTASKRLPMKA